MTISFNRRHLLAGAGAATLTTMVGANAPALASTLPPAPKPEDWAKAENIRNVCLSPNGRKIAYLQEKGGVKFIIEHDLDTKQSQTFNIGVAKVSSLSWIDDSHLSVATFATGKMERFAGGRQTFTIVSVYNIATPAINTLFADLPGFESFVTGNVNVINYKGKAQITASSYKTGFEDDAHYLYRFNLDGSGASVMDRGTVGTRSWIMTPQGDLVARTIYSDKSKTYSIEYNTGGWMEIYSLKCDIDRPYVAGLGRDGKALVVFMPTDDGEGMYYEMAPDGKLSAPLVKSAVNETPTFDPITFRLNGIRTYDGWSHYNYFAPVDQDIVKKTEKAMEGYRFVIIERGINPLQVIVYSEGSDDAGTYYYIDFRTGEVVTIGYAYPDIPVEWITSKSKITYKAADGTQIEAYLTLPPNREAKNLPLVVHPHGGPQARDGLGFDSEVQAYASRGYAVLQPNFRGSEGYGIKFTEAGYGQWGRKMQTDLSDGVRYLASQSIIDLKRVCISGASYGGYAALAGATLDTGVYNCAVDVSGISDIREFLDSKRPADAMYVPASYRYLQRFLGDEKTLDEISPIKHVDKCNIPVLIVHGKDDTVVEFSQSANMVKALKAAGKDVTFQPYEHEDHWQTNEAARTDMYKTIIAFIEKHNPPA